MNINQPARDLVLIVICVALAALMQPLYLSIVPLVSGLLASGLPTYQQELWLANVLLGMTFPIIVIYADYLNFWPFTTDNTENTEGVESNG